MIKKKGAIFDMDGTLLDSMGLWEEIDERFLKKRGIPLTPEYTEAMKRMGYNEGAKYTIQQYHLPETPEAIVEEWKEMAREAYAHQLKLKPGANVLDTALELVEDLKLATQALEKA